jgi:hypothetical protein
VGRKASFNINIRVSSLHAQGLCFALGIEARSSLCGVLVVGSIGTLAQIVNASHETQKVLPRDDLTSHNDEELLDWECLPRRA